MSRKFFESFVANHTQVNEDTAQNLYGEKKVNPLNNNKIKSQD